MMKRKFRWIPPVLWGILIAVFSLIPGGPGNLQIFGIPNIDKIGHFGMYAVWTFLFVLALSDNPRMAENKALWITILIGSLTGVILEYLQNYMNLGRVFEIEDMIANTLGASIGSWAGYLFYQLRNRPSRAN